MRKLWLIFCFIPFRFMQAQTVNPGAVISGPMPGPVELRTAVLWLQFSREIISVSLAYWKERQGNYDLYDITVSPLTSGVAKVSGIEINSPYPVPGSLVEARNYAIISVPGNKNERVLQIQFHGADERNLYSKSISEKQLMPKHDYSF